MSDLWIRHKATEQNRSQLPVSSYFSEALFEQEKQLIFDVEPRYVGHELMVPSIGDYYTLPHENDGRVMIKTPDGIELLSNVCRHRQSVMLRGRGNTQKNIVCPLHRWTYDLHGGLVGAPHFTENPCLNLKNYPLENWNGLIFTHSSTHSVSSALSQVADMEGVSFEGYVFDRVHIHECNYNWKTFIEVYLEDYHVGPFHPGLGSFVTCDDLKWKFGTHHSIQTVGIYKGLQQPGSKVYQRWHNELLRYRQGVAPQFGAIWLTYFPTVMIEWYPHVLVVSTLHPRSSNHTTNVVEFYYPEEIVAFERELVEAHQAAYLETCKEDDEIAHRMEQGRMALMQRGEDEYGPYQSPMEDGMKHFHDWYANMISRDLALASRI